jgi:hypothetical protein
MPRHLRSLFHIAHPSHAARTEPILPKLFGEQKLSTRSHHTFVPTTRFQSALSVTAANIAPPAKTTTPLGMRLCQIRPPDLPAWSRYSPLACLLDSSSLLSREHACQRSHLNRGPASLLLGLVGPSSPSKASIQESARMPSSRTNH